jgi:hypothetical protein
MHIIFMNYLMIFIYFMFYHLKLSIIENYIIKFLLINFFSIKYLNHHNNQ